MESSALPWPGVAGGRLGFGSLGPTLVGTCVGVEPSVADDDGAWVALLVGLFVVVPVGALLLGLLPGAGVPVQAARPAMAKAASAGVTNRKRMPLFYAAGSWPAAGRLWVAAISPVMAW